MHVTITSSEIGWLVGWVSLYYSKRNQSGCAHNSELRSTTDIAPDSAKMHAMAQFNLCQRLACHSDITFSFDHGFQFIIAASLQQQPCAGHSMFQLRISRETTRPAPDIDIG